MKNTNEVPVDHHTITFSHKHVNTRFLFRYVCETMECRSLTQNSTLELSKTYIAFFADLIFFIFLKQSRKTT